MKSKLKELDKFDALLWSIMLYGVLLRLRQYLANRSMWHDEANLALNIVHRDFAALLQPLDYDQGAPLGFLFITKFFTLLFGNYDYIMRILPIVAGILGVYFAYRLAKEYLDAGAPFFLLLFATSWSLVYYASEFKQYASDVMSVVILLYLGFRALDDEAINKDILTLGWVGFLLIWISHPAAFLVSGIGLALFFVKLIKRDFPSLPRILGLGAAWALSFGLNYLVSLRTLAADASLKQYWKNAFMPLPPWRDWGWFLKTYDVSLLRYSAAGFRIEPLPTLLAALALIGGLALLIRRWDMLIMLAAPLGMASIASMMGIYPIRGRLALFLLPFFFFLLAESFRLLYTLLKKWHWSIAGISYLALGVFILWLPIKLALQNLRTPRIDDHIKPVMAYVSEQREMDDIVYPYHGARPSFNYYAPFYGLDEGNIITGLDLANAQALKQFYKHVGNKLDGNPRVWVIFSHIVDCGGCEGDMETFYVNYLNEYGVIKNQYHAPGASVYLYDFSVP